VRCVFSQCLNDNALGSIRAGGPPGVPSGMGACGIAWRVVARLVGSTFDDVVATVFPADCRVCGGALAGVGAVPVCDGCTSRIQPQSMTLCGRCGEALEVESVRFADSQRADQQRECSACRRVPPTFARAVAYGTYDDELRELVHLLKYERARWVAGMLGSRLAAAIATLKSEAAKELLAVAVPLFPLKEQQRGYNQAVLLADAAIASLKKSGFGLKLIADHGVLRRTRDTESQFSLSPKDRRANLRGAFAVREGARIVGREVLLIDDIYTTGATARECALMLRRAGAAKVWVATVTRAQTESRAVAMWTDS
jgi:ComF family protein